MPLVRLALSAHSPIIPITCNIITHSAAGKLFQEIIGKPIPEPPPQLQSQISVRNVARYALEETMTEGSDAPAEYSSDGSEDRWRFALLHPM
jgi:hypothetical protein